MENLNELKPVGKLSPFAHFCCTIGNLPTSYMISLTYEEQLLWLCNYLEKTVIPAVNTNAEAVQELQDLYVVLKNYVENYFDNLDVQNEINNKLDEMVKDGTLDTILRKFIDNKYCVNAFDFGCVGDGETDDTNKLIELIAYTKEKNINYIDGQFKTYGVSNPITIDGIKLTNFNFKYIGDVVLDNVEGKQIFTIENSILENVNFNGNNINVGAFYSTQGNNRLINCKVENCKWYSFVFSGSSNNILEKCTAYRNGGVFQGGVFHFTEESNFNTIINCNAIENLGKGFDTLRSHNIIFENCYALNNQFENYSPRQYCYSIKFDTCKSIKNTDSNDFFISKNQTIMPTDNSGIKCSRGAYNSIITNCDIEQDGGTNVVSGIHNQGCQNITIENNRINSVNNGILVSWHPQDGVQYPASSPNNTTIRNNVINGLIGIFATLTTSYDKIKNLIIENNKITSSSYAIRCEDITNCIIDKNDINSQNVALYIYSSHNNQNYNDYTITNNIIKGLASDTNLINYCNKMILKNNNFEAPNNGTAIKFSNCDTINIINNYFNAFTGLQTQANKGFKIIGNTYKPKGSGAHYLWRATAQVDNSAIFSNNQYLDDGAPSNNFNLNYASITDSFHRVIVGVTEPPTSGTWARGDIAISSNPSTTNCVGWVCGINGTPGTWYPINITI